MQLSLIELREVVGRYVSDADLERGTLTIQRSLEQTKGGLAFQQPKSASGRRVIALPELAISDLRRHKAEQAKWRLNAGRAYSPNDLMLPAAEGQP